jgi:hypothetical protein
MTARRLANWMAVLATAYLLIRILQGAIAHV